MSVPILTIPETSFNPNAYMPARHARRSSVLRFMLNLTRTSAGALIVAYVVGIFALRPLMETTAAQRTEFLEAARSRLRSLYISLIGKVEYVPIVGIQRSAGSAKKVYADSVCQTEDLEKRQLAAHPRDTFGQNIVLEKLQTLLDRLNECLRYLIQEMEHYKVIDFSLKDLRQKAESVYFDQMSLFNALGPTRQSRNIAREVKQGIRSVKGMFMSGRA